MTAEEKSAQEPEEIETMQVCCDVQPNYMNC